MGVGQGGGRCVCVGGVNGDGGKRTYIYLRNSFLPSVLDNFMKPWKTLDEPLGLSYGPCAISQTTSEQKNFNSFTTRLSLCW